MGRSILAASADETITKLEVALSDVEISIAQFKQKKEELLRNIALLHQLRSNLEDISPELMDLLNATTQELHERGWDEQQEAELQGTYFERISLFLMRQKNTPLTILQISEGTGIPRPSVSAVVYRTHDNKFRVYEAAEGRAKRWCLRLSQSSGPGEFESVESREEEIPF